MPASTSYINRQGVTPNTRSIHSTKSRVFSYPSSSEAGEPNADMLQIGGISSFSQSDSRGEEVVRGIGYGDQIAEIVPGVSDPISLSIEKTAFYLQNIMQTFGYRAGIDGAVRALKHHRWPFDIKHEIVMPEVVLREQPGGGGGGLQPATILTAIARSTGGQAIVTWFEACWITSYSVAYPSDSALIAESVDVVCTDISDGHTRITEIFRSGNDMISRAFRGLEALMGI